MNIQDKCNLLKKLHKETIKDFMENKTGHICYVGQNLNLKNDIQKTIPNSEIKQIDSISDKTDMCDVFIIDSTSPSNFIQYAQLAKNNGSKVFMAMQELNDKTIHRLYSIGVDGFIDRYGTISDFCNGDMESRIEALDQSIVDLKQAFH